MAFLPYVENASIHGIENIAGIGYINIQIAQENGQILFVITDNGVGMDQAKKSASCCITSRMTRPWAIQSG
ncbi:sensor histidine kinase [Paenibacillus rhizoplanae]